LKPPYLVSPSREPGMAEPPEDGPLSCSAAWPICPTCAIPLVSSARKSWCDGCGAIFAASDRDPCPDGGSVRIYDSQGGYLGALCLAHATGALHTVEGIQAVGELPALPALDLNTFLDRMTRIGLV